VYTFSSPHQDALSSPVDTRKEAARIRAEIKHRNADIARKEAVDPYSFEVRKEPAEWRHYRLPELTRKACCARPRDKLAESQK
jgi:hypothetical protein